MRSIASGGRATGPPWRNASCSASSSCARWRWKGSDPVKSDEQAIRGVISAWLAASRAGDLQAVLKLMAEDVAFLRPGHPPMRGKAEFAASFKSIGDAKIDASSEVREIAVE